MGLSSELIASVGYDPKESVMEIEFISGRLYCYYAVPEHIYRMLLSSASAGAFFNSAIKGRYPYKDVGAI